MTCPSLVLSLKNNIAQYEGKSFKLPEAKMTVLYALNERWPKMVTIEQLITAMWGGNETPDQAKNTITVHVSGLRKILREQSDLRIVSTRKTGWRLLNRDQELERHEMDTTGRTFPNRKPKPEPVALPEGESQVAGFVLLLMSAVIFASGKHKRAAAS